MNRLEIMVRHNCNSVASILNMILIKIYSPAVCHLKGRILRSYPLPIVHSFLISKQTNPPCVISFTQSCELVNKKQFKTMNIHPLTGSLLVLFSISPQIILITLPFLSNILLHLQAIEFFRGNALSI